MGANENLDVTHRLSVLSVDEICILSVYMEDIFEHAQYEAWDSKDFCKGTEPELAWYCYEQRDSQQSKEYPPLLTPRGHEDGHEDGDA